MVALVSPNRNYNHKPNLKPKHRPMALVRALLLALVSVMLFVPQSHEHYTDDRMHRRGCEPMQT